MIAQAMWQWLCTVQAMWWVAGLTENKTKPASWGLAELGNIQNPKKYKT